MVIVRPLVFVTVAALGLCLSAAMSAPKAGASHMGAPKAGASHMGAPKSTASHMGAPKSGAGHMGAPKSGAGHMGATKSGADMAHSRETKFGNCLSSDRLLHSVTVPKASPLHRSLTTRTKYPKRAMDGGVITCVKQQPLSKPVDKAHMEGAKKYVELHFYGHD